jgi:aminoglycoside phosphotransferase family enzyme
MQTHLASFLNKEFVFHVDEYIDSSATRVVFNYSHPVMQDICLKKWVKCSNGVYETKDQAACTKYILEGFPFNKHFAPHIYLGIAPIIAESADILHCGPLIEQPDATNLNYDQPYALVMKRMEKGWRLDRKLSPDKLGNKPGMQFLAQYVASMHKNLHVSPPAIGTPDSLLAKLHFNQGHFQACLNRVQNDPVHFFYRKRINEGGMRWFRSIGWQLEEVSKTYSGDFKRRHEEKHIKRCHGDLKATNLWLCPITQSSLRKERLVALDCVDFNPDFCNIDTLSDVAMLAIDLETRLVGMSNLAENKARGQQLARHFIHTYLEAAGETKNILPLLEYYLIEKAMVCAYMSILFDELPVLGEKYLDVVLTHSQNLAVYLPQKIARMITKPLHLIAN